MGYYIISNVNKEFEGNRNIGAKKTNYIKTKVSIERYGVIWQTIECARNRL